MRNVFFASNKKLEQDLAANMVKGIRGQGGKAEVRTLCANNNLSDCDVAMMVGVKSKRLFDQCENAGIIPVMFDKGYIRGRRVDSRVWEYWRVSVGAHHPTATIMQKKLPDDRWKNLGVKVDPWKTWGHHIVLAGSSAKYHRFYDLPDPTEWARGVIEEIRKHSDLPIIYRPKPSWKEAVPIRGAEFSGREKAQSINQDLWGAHCLITHGSNACFEALIAGVPVIVLGNGVAKVVSRQSVADVMELTRPKREQFFANLAYYQWTEKEMASGECWNFMKGLINGLRR